MFIESYTQPDIWCLVMKFLIGVVIVFTQLHTNNITLITIFLLVFHTETRKEMRQILPWGTHQAPSSEYLRKSLEILKKFEL